MSGVPLPPAPDLASPVAVSRDAKGGLFLPSSAAPEPLHVGDSATQNFKRNARDSPEIKRKHPQELQSATNEALERMRSTDFHNESLAALNKLAQDEDDHRDICSEVFYSHIRDHLRGCIFVGHVNTDLDSVAGAIGAAALFDGVAAISEKKLNGEILFALKECGIETPILFDDAPGAKTCLVDHSEDKQMTPLLRDAKNRAARIAGIIDHHALAESFSTSKPLYMDLRPWGSMSTIIPLMASPFSSCRISAPPPFFSNGITVLFLSHKRHLPPKIAKMLLMAVLSDTLNLQSVTTTDADRQVVTLLSAYGGVANPDELARMQFQKKTDFIVNLGAYEMVRGDQKDFKCGDWKCGISVLEVTAPELVLAIAEEIMLELRMLKKEKGECTETVRLPRGQCGGSSPVASAAAASTRMEKQVKKIRDHRKELDFAYLFVVDILNEVSYLIIAGGRELVLAKKAFPNAPLSRCVPHLEDAPGKTIGVDETMMTLPKGYVSRKAQFAPAFLNALADFTCHKVPATQMPAPATVEEDYSEKVYLDSKDAWEHDSVKLSRTSRVFKRSASSSPASGNRSKDTRNACVCFA
ncbi:unnamed protein product [Amoebophrya sp. A25]|nr:unnamed protein product [Amoebophrya sp. A25]|eukprot:GSA25T00024593001.1